MGSGKYGHFLAALFILYKGKNTIYKNLKVWILPSLFTHFLASLFILYKGKNTIYKNLGSFFTLGLGPHL